MVSGLAPVKSPIIKAMFKPNESISILFQIDLKYPNFYLIICLNSITRKKAIIARTIARKIRSTTIAVYTFGFFIYFS